MPNVSSISYETAPHHILLFIHLFIFNVIHISQLIVIYINHHFPKDRTKKVANRLAQLKLCYSLRFDPLR